MSPPGARRPGLVATVLFLLAVAAGVAAGSRADAHPYLVRAEPPPSSSLAVAPKELRLLFTERLDGPYCRVTLVGPGTGRRVAGVQVTGTSLVANLGDLGPGRYRVEWSVVGDDGHRVEGEYSLGVGTAGAGAAAVAAVAGRPSDQVAGGAITRAVQVAVDVALVAVVLAVVLFRFAYDSRRSRSISVMRTLWVAAVGVAIISLVQVRAGHAAVWSTVTGRLALQRVLATLALFPVAFELLRGTLLRGIYAVVAGVNLLVAVALASHALAASTGRTAQVAVLTMHLVAASVWLAALVALLAGAPARRLAVPVAASIAVVVVTGAFNAHVQLGGARELLASAYGRVLDIKVALVVLMTCLGLAAVWRRWEAVAGVGVLALAGVLGQLPNPVSVPAFAQRHPLPAGSTVVTTSTGASLVAMALSPSRPGLNRLVVTVQQPDANDIPIPAAGVGGIDVAGACTCNAQPVAGRLAPVDGGPTLAGSLLLPRPGRWTLRMAAPDGVAIADVDVSPSPTEDEIVVGVPADLSGPDAEPCQDELLGVQVAAAEANEGGVAGGRAVRVVAVDSHGPDPAASVPALRSLGAKLLAVPCGPPEAVVAIERAAPAAGMSVIGGGGYPAPGLWPTLASPNTEGKALAAQVQRQGGRRPLVVVGAGAHERAVASTATAALDKDGLAVTSLGAGDAATTAARIRADNPDVVVFILSEREAVPLLQAVAAVDPGWGPVHGAVGNSSMMSATVASTAGDWFKQGRVSVASEVNPSDGSSLDYATRLREGFPGRHPSVQGVRGYVAGWLIANVLHRAPAATPDAVRRVFATQLRSFVFGPTHLRWGGSEGGAESMAFFRTVFTNPLALAGLPGQVGHSGVFLGQGAFVQVTPFLT